MKKYEYVKVLKKALANEKQTWEPATADLKKQLYLSIPLRSKKPIHRFILGFSMIIIVFLIICIQGPRAAHDYFKPTKVIDCNDESRMFKPTIIIQAKGDRP